jgi:hypothetical protein
MSEETLLTMGDFAQLAERQVRAYLASRTLPVEPQNAQP